MKIEVLSMAAFVFRLAVISCIIRRIEDGYALLTPCGEGKSKHFERIMSAGCREALIAVLWGKFGPGKNRRGFRLQAGEEIGKMTCGVIFRDNSGERTAV